MPWALLFRFNSASQKNAPDPGEMKAVNDTFGCADGSPEEVQGDREQKTAARGALADLKSVEFPTTTFIGGGGQRTNGARRSFSRLPNEPR